MPDASAYGRRIFNDEEIDADMEESLFQNMMSLDKPLDAIKHIACKDREKLQKLGLWDIVYNKGKCRK